MRVHLLPRLTHWHGRKPVQPIARRLLSLAHAPPKHSATFKIASGLPQSQNILLTRGTQVRLEHTSSRSVSSERHGPTTVARDGTLDPVELTCDEEPHMLSIRRGGIGYIPMQFGQTFEDLEGGKYEIVRKLGWGSNSSVWLAKLTSYEPFCLSISFSDVPLGSQRRARAICSDQSPHSQPYPWHRSRSAL